MGELSEVEPRLGARRGRAVLRLRLRLSIDWGRRSAQGYVMFAA